MAENFKHSGRSVAIVSASANIASGALVNQEGVLGVAETAIASGQGGVMSTQGAYYLPVPSGTVKGDKLYADLSTESVAVALTKTAGGNTFVGIAESARDTALSAIVNLMPSFAGTMAAVGAVHAVTVTETAGAGAYTGSVTVPAGSLITNIRVQNTALWTNAGAVAAIVGDATDPNGWFDAVNMKATDLLVGEELNFDNAGGKQGVYLDTSSGKRAAAYCVAETVVSIEVTSASTGGGAGRTTMWVEFITPSTTVVAAKV